MAKSAEIKAKITVEGASQASAEINKVDAAADKASKGGVKSLSTAVSSEMKGALDKIPGASTLASGGISALGAASVAGGAALAGFAVKGVMAFEQTTVAVGQFRDATGTTSEEASRFVEVFGDLGIGAEAGQAAIGKMEKALGANSEAFAKYGVEVVRAKDGTVDAQGTFLGAVDALNNIENPLKRAEAGAAIFGKGWASMSEIIAGGAGPLKDALESVQPSKVFSDKDIKSGRDVRDAFDTIKDAGEGLLLTIGKSLAPAIASLAPFIGQAVDAIGPLVEQLGTTLAQALENAAPLLKATAQGVGLVSDALALASKSAQQWGDAIGDEKQLPDGAEYGSLAAAVDIAGKSLGDQAESARLAGEAQAYLSQQSVQTTADTQEMANAAIHADDAIADEKLSSEDTADALGKLADEQHAAAKAADVHRAAIDAMVDAQIGAADSSIGLVNANRKMADATSAATKVLKDHKASADDVQQALDNERDAAIDAAGAAVRYADDHAKAAGSTLDATGKIDAMNASLISSATTATPQAQAAIISYMAEVNQIPEEKATEIQAAINRGDLATAQRLLDEASATRAASFNPFVDPASAAATSHQLDQLTRDRLVKVVTSGVGGPVRAAGGPVSAGEAYVVGDRPSTPGYGPDAELFVPNQAGTIVPHDRVNWDGGNGGPTVVNNITNVTHVRAPISYNPVDALLATQRQAHRRGDRS